jgi:hypothetical protein
MSGRTSDERGPGGDRRRLSEGRPDDCVGQRALPGAAIALVLFALAFALADLGRRELPAPGVVRVEPVRVGVEPAGLDLRERVGGGLGLLGLAPAHGGGFGLGLIALLRRRLSDAMGPAGSGRGRAPTSGEPLALACERADEDGHPLPVAERPGGDADRLGGLCLPLPAGEQAGGPPLLAGPLALAAPLGVELPLRPRSRAAPPAPALEGGFGSGRLGGGTCALGRRRLRRGQRYRVGERRAERAGLEPVPVPLRAASGEAALKLGDDRLGGEPIGAGLGVRELQLQRRADLELPQCGGT